MIIYSGQKSRDSKESLLLLCNTFCRLLLTLDFIVFSASYVIYPLSFDRPGFQEMMSLARKGKIGIIIVKDLSRFGRNHIETDIYLEQIFPFLGIRFIAINDNVDSRNFESGLPGMDVGFRNIIRLWAKADTCHQMQAACEMSAEV